MKAIRITFKSEDFAAVSKSLIDLNVKFQVETVEDKQTASRTRDLSGGPAAVTRGASPRTKSKRTSRRSRSKGVSTRAERVAAFQQSRAGDTAEERVDAAGLEPSRDEPTLENSERTATDVGLES